MKYLIRSVKYFFYFAVLCSIVLVLTFHFSTKPEGLTLMDMLLVDGSMYKMLAFFVAVAAIYPALGFQKKMLYVSNIIEHKREIVDLFQNANYQLVEDDATKMVFTLKNPVIRFIRLYEDSVTIDLSDNPVMMEGLRKDVLRFSRGIEYICQKGEE